MSPARTKKADLQTLWPSLPLQEWKETYDTLHMWTQIPGKIRLALTPLVNHWWEVPYYVTARGLTTSPIPYGTRTFEINFDFIDHDLVIQTSEGLMRHMALAPKSVATFYEEIMELLHSLDISVSIDNLPSEFPDPIPFPEDHTHTAYNRKYAHRHWRILVQADRLMKKFRGPFLGKCSPVHFFWGSFDLAVTRFSGRRAPEHPELDHMTREGYSHEVLSVGFWPGSENIQDPAFYAYAAPEPEGYATDRRIQPPAFYNEPTHGYILMYEEVRNASDPDRMVLDFFQNTYEAGADRGNWDRASLERQPLLKPKLRPSAPFEQQSSM